MSAHELTCPHCFSVLRLKAIPSDGTRVKCPVCLKPFVIDAAAREGIPTLESVTPERPIAKLASPGPQVAQTVATVRRVSQPVARAPQVVQPARVEHQIDETRSDRILAWVLGGFLAATLLFGTVGAAVWYRLSPSNPKAAQSKSTAGESASPTESVQDTRISTVADTSVPSSPFDEGQDTVGPVAIADEEISAAQPVHDEGQPLDLRYALQPEKTYKYQFELTSIGNTDGKKLSSGFVDYRLSPSPDPDRLRVSFYGSVGSGGGIPDHVNGTTVIRDRGELITVESEHDINLFTTRVGAMPFARLPAPGETQWKSTYSSTVLFDVDDPHDPFADIRRMHRRHRDLIPRRFGSPRFGRSPFEDPGQRVTIETIIDYQLGAVTPTTAEIKTKFAALMNEVGTGKEFGRVDGTGILIFDRDKKVIVRNDTEQTLAFATDGVNVNVPMKFHYELTGVFTPEELKQHAEEIKAKVEARMAAGRAESLARSKPQVAEAITMLKQPTLGEQEIAIALTKLYFAEADPERRDEVSNLLNGPLQHSSADIRKKAIDTCHKWATAANIPLLLKLLDSEGEERRNTTIEALGATGGSAEVVDRLVLLLDQQSTRHRAISALRKCGTYAEDKLLDGLDSPNDEVLRNAIEVLKDAGGEKTIAAIDKRLANAPQSSNAFRLKVARDRIQKRLAKAEK